MRNAVSAPGKTGSTDSGLTPPSVNRAMRVEEVITLCPAAADIMAAYGLHCFSCSVGGAESLAEGCAMHGFDDDTVDALIIDLNEAISDQPPPEAVLHVTKAAAEAIQGISAQENREGEGLLVIAEANGGFCLEFQTDPSADDLVFNHAEVPEVRVFASPATLWRIGGSTIDFRDGRFKLDLATEKEGCGAVEIVRARMEEEKANVAANKSFWIIDIHTLVVY